MLRALCACALVALIVGMVPHVSAQASDPIAVVQGFEAALNAKDLDGAMSYWADDAVLTDTHPAPGQPNPLMGKAAIRANFEFAIKNSARYDSTNFQTAGDTVTWQGKIYIDPAAFGPGFPSPIESHYQARVQNGKITAYTIDNDAAWLARVPKELLPQTGGETLAPTTGAIIIGGIVLLVLGWLLRRGYARITP